MIYALLRHLVLPRARKNIERIEGLENVPTHGPFILASNHVSWFDPVYLTAAVRERFHERVLFLAATTKHWWTRAIIPITKNQPSKCLQIALRHLHRGRAIGIFPRGDQRHPFVHPKTGAARLARWARCPIVPVALQSTKPGHTFRSIREYFRGGHSMTIRFGAAISFSDGPTDDRDVLRRDMSRIEKVIAALMKSFSRT